MGEKMSRIGSLCGGENLAAVYLAAGAAAPGLYGMRGLYDAEVGVVESFGKVPQEWRSGPFLGTPARGVPAGDVAYVGAERFQAPLLRAAEDIHGPIVWTIIRRPFRERGEDGRLGRVALGVRASDGEPVAIVSQLQR